MSGEIRMTGGRVQSAPSPSSRAARLRLLKRPAQVAYEARTCRLVVGLRRRRAPHRLWPGEIGPVTRDDVHVQLRHDIADGCDVELVAGGDRLERGADARDLGRELALRVLLQVD